MGCSNEGLLPGSSRFVASLLHVVDASFIRYLVLTYFGLKGIVTQLLSNAMLPYLQLMGVSGTGFQLATVVAMIPWSMKGCVGVLSDCVPLGRYHKRGYLLLAAAVGLVGFTDLAGASPAAKGPSALWSVAVLFGLGNAMTATFDLLCEGKYSELMRERHGGSEVLTMVWTCVQAGSLVGALATGVAVDALGPRTMLAACVPLAVLALWRTAAGDLPEKPARSWVLLRLKALSEPTLFLLATAMAAGSLAVALSVALLGARLSMAVTVGVTGLLTAASFKALPRTLARSNLYMFLISAAYVDLSGPLAYFYTGAAGCVVDAPHFSYGYYLSVSNIMGSAAGALGAVLFQRMQDWQFRTAFCMTSLIQVLSSVFDLIIVNRWNIAFGVPDEAAYLFGDAACQSLAAMMAMMPMAMLTARLCPRGAEATVFAILAGFQNFGSTVSSILGVQLAAAFGVEAGSAIGPCDFRGLSALIVFAHCVAPVACIPLTWWLVPAARIDDDAAFEASPPPSFRSPAPSSPGSPVHSPRASPRPPPAEGDIEEVSMYWLLSGDESQFRRALSGVIAPSPTWNRGPAWHGEQRRSFGLPATPLHPH